MLLKQQLELVTKKLIQVLHLLSEEEYKSPSILLSNHSIGAHTRHIIELFLCLLDGYEVGTICYATRQRDKRIEMDSILAVQLLLYIETEINKPNKPLVMQELNASSEPDHLDIDTNYDREVLYNIEHAIHHMALISIGVKEKSKIRLPENFGVAYSTSEHKKSCAQ